MPGQNLSKAEAAGRAAIVAVEHYDVVLDLSEVRTSPTFASRTTVTFTATPGAETWIDLVADAVVSATLNGRSLDPATFADSRLPLPGLAERNELVVDARCKYTRDGTGLHRFVDPVDDEVYLYTQFECPDARQMYANFEQPDLKAEFTFTVTAPNHWEVVSNNTEASRVPAGAGTDTWSFERTKRMSTYITAIVAGPYFHVHDSYSGRFGTYPLGIYCRKSLGEFLDADAIFTLTKQGFAFFEEQFDLGYPFGKYDQLFCPEYNAGAMENAGCVTFLEDYVFRSRVTRMQYMARANTILHEMAHMWFGDLVTMEWWEDLWLNESFAEWAAYWAMGNATEFTDAWVEFLSLRKEWGYRQDQLPSTHPIAASMPDLDSVRPNFDGISYAKGASVLKQLVAYVGEEAFIAGVRVYLRKYAYGNARLEHLLVELSAASGRDLSAWMDSWIQTPGVNLLRAQIAADGDGIITDFVVEQLPPQEPAGLAPSLRNHRIAIGFYDLVDGTLQRTAQHWVDISGERTSLDALVNHTRPAVVLLNDDDHSFAKIRLDAHSLRNAIENYGAFDDPLARTLVWMSAWDMTRDGELPTRDWLALMSQAIDTESEVSVLTMQLRYSKLAVDFYGNPARRSGYYRDLATALNDAVRNAAAGSDHQVALMRGLLMFAAESHHLDWIGGLLDGECTLPGLKIDADMRWSMLTRLVATGARDAAAIEAEVARDNTAFGQRSAAAARAAVPTAEAKAAAWTLLTETKDVANSVYEYTALGFRQPEQAELLAPYVARYFVDLEHVWTLHEHHMAEDFSLFAFPGIFVEPAVVEMATEFLDTHTGGHVAMLRYVNEGRANVVRAMRARQADI